MAILPLYMHYFTICGIIHLFGYLFANWFIDELLTSAYNFSSRVYSNITLYAKWTIPYTVSFDTNGGTNLSPKIVPEGGLVKKPLPPQKTDYIFVNWYIDENFFSVYNFNEPVNMNLTLYANMDYSIS